MDMSPARARSRRNLDARFMEIGPASRFAAPVRGWVKAVRESLGMSTAQLAARLGISQPAVVQMERAESKGAITLRTLQRAAAALDCQLVYALVPNRPLETMVRDRAREIARRQLQPVRHSMLLEGQSLAADDDEAALEAYIAALKTRDLWDEP